MSKITLIMSAIALIECVGLSSCALSEGGADGGRAIGSDQAQQHCLTYRKYAVITAQENRDAFGREVVRFNCLALPKDVPPLNSGFYDPKNAYFINKRQENPWPIPR
jgi:hypothetical protein